MALRKLAAQPLAATAAAIRLKGSSASVHRSTLGTMGILLLGHISSIEVYDLLGLPGSQGRTLRGADPVELDECLCLSVLGPACTSTRLLGEQLGRDLPYPPAPHRPTEVQGDSHDPVHPPRVAL